MNSMVYRCQHSRKSNFATEPSDVHASKGKKQFAVFVLTHLVEDIQQPLHGSDNEDQGGNQIKVKLPDGRKVNLHTVWDTSLVERLYGRQNEMTVAKRLVQKYASRATEWQTGKIDLVTIQASMASPHASPRRWRMASCQASPVGRTWNRRVSPSPTSICSKPNRSWKRNWRRRGIGWPSC